MVAMQWVHHKAQHHMTREKNGREMQAVIEQGESCPTKSVPEACIYSAWRHQASRAYLFSHPPSPMCPVCNSMAKLSSSARQKRATWRAQGPCASSAVHIGALGHVACQNVFLPCTANIMQLPVYSALKPATNILKPQPACDPNVEHTQV